MYARISAARFAPTVVLCLVASTVAAQQPDLCPTQGAKLTPEAQRTVVIAGADKPILDLADFSFSTAIKTILDSAKLPSDEPAQIAAVQSLIDTFKDDHAVHPVDGRTISTPVRAEKDMLAADLLKTTGPNAMHPIGLFNRFDQMSDDAPYCGEQRIVYSQDRNTGRFFLIFEAAVRNPRPELKKEGCRPVAELWQSLKSANNTQIAERMSNFYFKGIPNPDPKLAIQPVLHVEHFGNPFGQVRGNIFKQVPWQLREWHVDPPTGKFVSKPVGTNPEPKFYTPPSSALSPADTALRSEFEDFFVDTLAEQLTEADASATKPADLINHVSMAHDRLAKFNDFTSNAPVSGTTADNPTVAATAQGDFVDRIKAKLGQGRVTFTHVLNRAGANACGGCHRFAAESGGIIGVLPDGTAVQWPQSLGFVHIQEDGALSPLLTDFFLPDRCQQFNETFFVPAAPPAVALAEPRNPTQTLSEFTTQLRSMSPQAQTASRRVRDELILLERANDRAQPSATRRRRQPD